MKCTLHPWNDLRPLFTSMYCEICSPPPGKRVSDVDTRWWPHVWPERLGEPDVVRVDPDRGFTHPKCHQVADVVLGIHPVGTIYVQKDRFTSGTMTAKSVPPHCLERLRELTTGPEIQVQWSIFRIPMLYLRRQPGK